MLVEGRITSLRPGNYESVCLRCLARRTFRSFEMQRRAFSASPAKPSAITSKLPSRRTFRREYFSANGSIDSLESGIYKASWRAARVAQGQAAAINLPQKPVDPPPLSSTQDAPPSQPTGYLKRRRTRSNSISGADTPIPLDASSRLSSISSALPASSFRRLFTVCLSLSKPRLSALIVLTTAAAYPLYPVPTVLLPSTTVSPSLSALTLVFLTSGTALCCASANSLNMLMEPEYDAKMSRTRNRPLVRGLIGKKGALIFAGVAGVLGFGGLWFGVNPTVAFLGGLNIALYAGVYTPMKRISVVNTWVGALVGGIPPLMGWAAAAGQSATHGGGWQELLLGEQNIGGWLLAGLLFAWQFPHFNALSWSIREEYKNAGYRMLCWTNTRMNGRVALRYSLMLFPICIGLTYFGVTDQAFLVTSSVVNLWMAREAWKFWRHEGHKGSARGLFWASVWHLPVILVLAMAHKKGLWEGIWNKAFGQGSEDDDEEWLDEDEDEVLDNRIETTDRPQPLTQPARVA